MLQSLLWPVNIVVEVLGSELVSTSACMNTLGVIGMRVLIPLRAWTRLRLLLRASQGTAWMWCRTLPMPLGSTGCCTRESWGCS